MTNMETLVYVLFAFSLAQGTVIALLFRRVEALTNAVERMLK